ncbi:hypothetical protein GXW78_26775 [Roseomonas terrae]|uniref:PepSY domain-containing protein n=1 Tax=Neoroseomonas terrae TaxID=424799 RepID=A0ABS5EQI4_9PROT|nr:hypothetical protein [Neoroseomonas terrae]MBR0653286.1 hypothetical protein [Neoroseomonas terrae]
MKWVLTLAVMLASATAIAPQVGAQTPVPNQNTTQPGPLPRGDISEAVAQSRLQAAGLRNIRDLTRRSDGTWRAQVTSSQGVDGEAIIDAGGNVQLSDGVARNPMPTPR